MVKKPSKATKAFASSPTRKKPRKKVTKIVKAKPIKPQRMAGSINGTIEKWFKAHGKEEYSTLNSLDRFLTKAIRTIYGDSQTRYVKAELFKGAGNLVKTYVTQTARNMKTGEQNIGNTPGGSAAITSLTKGLNLFSSRVKMPIGYTRQIKTVIRTGFAPTKDKTTLPFTAYNTTGNFSSVGQPVTYEGDATLEKADSHKTLTTGINQSRFTAFPCQLPNLAERRLSIFSGPPNWTGTQSPTIQDVKDFWDAQKSADDNQVEEDRKYIPYTMTNTFKITNNLTQLPVRLKLTYFQFKMGRTEELATVDSGYTSLAVDPLQTLRSLRTKVPEIYWTADESRNQSKDQNNGGAVTYKEAYTGMQDILGVTNTEKTVLRSGYSGVLAVGKSLRSAETYNTCIHEIMEPETYTLTPGNSLELVLERHMNKNYSDLGNLDQVYNGSVPTTYNYAVSDDVYLMVEQQGAGRNTNFYQVSPKTSDPTQFDEPIWSSGVSPSSITFSQKMHYTYYREYDAFTNFVRKYTINEQLKLTSLPLVVQPSQIYASEQAYLDDTSPTKPTACTIIPQIERDDYKLVGVNNQRRVKL